MGSYPALQHTEWVRIAPSVTDQYQGGMVQPISAVGSANYNHITGSTYLRKMEVSAIWIHRFCIPSTLLRKKNTTATMASNDGIMKKANMNFS
jgi:hypothetical protein